MTADHTPTPILSKDTTMNRAPRNPFAPVYQRPERIDTTWQRRRDPIAYAAVQELTRRGY